MGGAQIWASDNKPPDDVLLYIRGLSRDVEEAKRVLVERLETCEQLVYEYIVCPYGKMPQLCGKRFSGIESLERACGACVTVKAGNLHCFEGEDDQRMCQIEVAGTQEQVTRG